jgi:hypothetical protein
MITYDYLLEDISTKPWLLIGRYWKDDSQSCDILYSPARSKMCKDWQFLGEDPMCTMLVEGEGQFSES